jgi:hypothetical protein
MSIEEIKSLYNSFIDKLQLSVTDLRAMGEEAEAETREQVIRRVTKWVNAPDLRELPDIGDELWQETGLTPPQKSAEAEEQQTSHEFTGDPKLDECIVLADSYRRDILENNIKEKYSEVVSTCLLAIPYIETLKLKNIQKIKYNFEDLKAEATNRLNKITTELVNQAFKEKDLEKIEQAIRLNPSDESLKVKYQELLSELHQGDELSIEVETIRGYMKDPNYPPNELDTLVRRAEYLDKHNNSLTDEEFRQLRFKAREKLNSIHNRDGKTNSASLIGDLKERAKEYFDAKNNERLKYVDRTGNWVDYPTWLGMTQKAWEAGSQYTTQDRINKARQYLPHDPIAFTDFLVDFKTEYAEYLHVNDKASIETEIKDQVENVKFETTAKQLVSEARSDSQPYEKYVKRVKAKLIWPGLLKINIYAKLQDEINKLRPRALDAYIDALDGRVKTIETDVKSIYADQDITSVHHKLDKAILDLGAIQESAALWEEDRESSEDENVLPLEIKNFRNDLISLKNHFVDEKNLATRIHDTAISIKELLKDTTPQKIQEASSLLKAIEKEHGIDRLQSYALYQAINNMITSQSTFSEAVERVTTNYDHSNDRKGWLSIRKEIAELQNRNDFHGNCTEELKKQLRLIDFRLHIRLTIDDAKGLADSYEWEQIRTTFEDLKNKSKELSAEFPEFEGLDFKELSQKVLDCNTPAAMTIDEYFTQLLSRNGLEKRSNEQTIRRELDSRPVDGVFELFTDLRYISGETNYPGPQGLAFSRSFPQAEANRYKKICKGYIKEKILRPAISLYKNQSGKSEDPVKLEKHRKELHRLNELGLIETDEESKTLEWFEIQKALLLQKGEDKYSWDKLIGIWSTLLSNYPSNPTVRLNYKNAIIQNCISKVNTEGTLDGKVSMLKETLANQEIDSNNPSLIYKLAHVYWDEKKYDEARIWIEKIDPDTVKNATYDLDLELAELYAEQIAEEKLALGDFGGMVLFLGQQLIEEPLKNSTRINRYYNKFIEQKTTELNTLIVDNRGGDANRKMIAFEAIVDLEVLESAMGIPPQQQTAGALLDASIDVLPITTGEVIANARNYYNVFQQDSLEDAIKEAQVIVRRLEVISRMISANTYPNGPIPVNPQPNEQLVNLINMVLEAKHRPTINIFNQVTIGQLSENLRTATTFLDDLKRLKFEIERSEEIDESTGDRWRYADGLRDNSSTIASFVKLSEIENRINQLSDIVKSHKSAKSFSERLEEYRNTKEWVSTKIGDIIQAFRLEDYSKVLSLIEELNTGPDRLVISDQEYSWILKIMDDMIRCEDPLCFLSPDNTIYIDHELIYYKQEQVKPIAKKRSDQIETIKKRKVQAKQINDDIASFGYGWTLEIDRNLNLLLENRKNVIEKTKNQDLVLAFQQICREQEIIESLEKMVENFYNGDRNFDVDYQETLFSYSSATSDIKNKLAVIQLCDLSEPENILSTFAQDEKINLMKIIKQIQQKSSQLEANCDNLIKRIDNHYANNDILLPTIKSGNLVASRNLINKSILNGLVISSKTEETRIIDRIGDYLKRIDNQNHQGNFLDRIFGRN